MLFGLSISTYAQKNYCSDVLKSGSELTGDSLYRSHAVWFDKNSNVMIAKGKSKGQSKYMVLSFTVFTSELSYQLKGLYVKFSDGSIFKSPETKIEVEYNGGSRFEYRALMFLSREQIEKLKQEKIVMANFAYSGDVKLTEYESERLRQYIICMDSNN